MRYNKPLSTLLISTLILTQSFSCLAKEPSLETRPPAQKSTFGLSVADDLLAGQGEYVAGKYPGAVMMKVNLWGGVRQPGVYHIPIGTDLVTLLSYAGGPSQTGNLDETRIKRSNNEVIDVNVEDLLKGKQDPSKNLGLKVNDIVMVPETKPIISSNTVLLLSVVATLATILVASYSLSTAISNKK